MTDTNTDALIEKILSAVAYCGGVPWADVIHDKAVEAIPILAARARLADQLEAALRDVQSFVSTGGPLYNKDRLELLKIVSAALARDTERKP